MKIGKKREDERETERERWQLKWNLAWEATGSSGAVGKPLSKWNPKKGLTWTQFGNLLISLARPPSLPLSVCLSGIPSWVVITEQRLPRNAKRFLTGAPSLNQNCRHREKRQMFDTVSIEILANLSSKLRWQHIYTRIHNSPWPCPLPKMVSAQINQSQGDTWNRSQPTGQLELDTKLVETKAKSS